MSRVRPNDKDDILGAVRDLADMGFKIVATRGTRRHFEAHGIATEQVNKVLEGRPHIVDMMKNGDVQLVFNTTEGARALGRFEGHPADGLDEPYSVLYNSGWRTGGDRGYQGLAFRQFAGGSVAKLLRALNLGVASRLCLSAL